MKRVLNKLFTIILFLCCYLSTLSFFNDSVNVTLARDYTNLTFECGQTTMPSDLLLSSQGTPHIVTNFTKNNVSFESVIYITDGGQTTFPYQKPDPSKNKRWLGFTLYESVEMEIGLFASSKDFILTDDNGEITRFTSEKYIETIYTYTFIDIPSTGKNFYIGGTNSQQYITLLKWSSPVPKAYFDANGGKFSDGSTRKNSPQVGSEEFASSLNEIPTKEEGNEFLGWSESKNNDETSIVSEFEFGKTYYAVWGKPVVKSISFNSTFIEIDDGTGAFIRYTVSPSEAEAKDIYWSSEDENIATVTQNGYVEAINPGTTYITLTIDGVSASIKVVVKSVNVFVVSFILEGYNQVDVEVLEGYQVEVPSYFKGTLGYDVIWYNNNQEFDFENTLIRENITLIGELVPNKYATKVHINEIDLLDEDNALDINKVNKITYTLSRDDEYPIEIVEPVFFTSSDDSVISIDNQGNLTAHQMGKVQVRVRIYSSTDSHTIISDPITIKNTKKIIDEEIIDTTLDIVIDKGKFKSSGDSENAIRFIGVINKSYFPYILSSSMEITAVDYKGEIIGNYYVDIYSFYDEVEYISKTPSTSSLKKKWSSEGKLGAPVTLTKIPLYAFEGGKLIVKFSVTDAESRLTLTEERVVEY